MVRIGGGVFPEIKEKDYIGEGAYRVDNKVTKVRRLLLRFDSTDLSSSALRCFIHILTCINCPDI